MDLLAIWRTFWRHKFAMLPVLLLTMIGAGYVMFFVPSVFEARASYVLVAPPAPPSERDVELNPSLADVNADNPYVNLDSSVVISIVAQRLTTKEMREQMAQQGAGDQYQVAPSSRYGFVSPIVDVTGVGDSVASAVGSATIIGDAVQAELRNLQESQGVDDTYLISTLPVEVPVDAEERVSSKLRSLIAVLGVGGLLAFALLSVLQARDRLRDERSSSSDIPRGGTGQSATAFTSPLKTSHEETPAAETTASTESVGEPLDGTEPAGPTQSPALTQRGKPVAATPISLSDRLDAASSMAAARRLATRRSVSETAAMGAAVHRRTKRRASANGSGAQQVLPVWLGGVSQAATRLTAVASTTEDAAGSYPVSRPDGDGEGDTWPEHPPQRTSSKNRSRS